MVDVRFSQLVRETSAQNADAEIVVSQIVRITSIRVVPAFVRISQIVRITSVPVFFTEKVRLSQLVRIVSIPVPALGTACEVAPINIESSYTVLPQADWTEPVRMETSWLTDISASKVARAEDRMIAYRRPLRTISAKLSGYDRDGERNSTRLAKTIKRYAHNRNPVPLWQDRRTINAQANSGQNEIQISTTYRRFYPGQRVGIVKPDGGQINSLDVVFAFIEAVAADRIYLTQNLSVTLEAGWHVYPMIDCDVIPQTQIDLGSDNVASAKVTGLEIAGCMALPASSGEDVSGIFDYIDGYPVLDVVQNWAEGVSYEVRREAESYQSGRTQAVSASGSRAVEIFEMSFGPLTRAQFWDLLQFHDSRRGRARGCWILHPQTMWTFIGSGLDYIDVRAVGYANDIPELFTHVAYIEPDGTIGIRPIVSASVETGPTRHRLHLNAISVAPPSLIDRVTAAVFCREDSDTATEEWATEDICASFSMSFRGLLAEGTVEIE